MRALLLGLAMSVACSPAAEEESVIGRPVFLTPVRQVDLVDHIEATGELIAVERAPISAEVGGRITEILLDESQEALAGDVVMLIDPERRRLELDRARAGADEAAASTKDKEREYARIAELHQRHVASETQLDQASTELQRAQARQLAAQADLGVAERELRDAQVMAPFSGFIAQRMVGRGEFVSQGTPLFELVALDPIQVEFHLPEVDSARVKRGHAVGIRVAPYPDRVFSAEITAVSPTIDSRTRTLRIRAELGNPEGLLRPGLFARVDVGLSTRRGIAMIPEEAVLQRGDGAVVFRLAEESRVERIVIQTGAYQQGSVEVIAGLEPGDLIVSRGQSALNDGDRVVLRQPDGTLMEAPMPPVAARDPQ
jgi:membrane fusion protein (multidrug efflux system)